MPDECWMNEETERRLHANDPTVTSVAFRQVKHKHLLQADDLVRIVKALGQSTHVTKLFLNFNFLDEIVEGDLSEGSKGLEGLKQLIIWIMTNAKLDTVHLDSWFQSRETSSVLMRTLMTALGARYLKSVTLESVEVRAEDLVQFFSKSNFLQEFSMKTCVIEQGSFTTVDMAARKVAESLASVKYLSTLELDVTNWNQAYFVAICKQVQSHTAIKILKFCNHTLNVPVVSFNAITNLLQKATVEGLWKELHLDSFHWTDATMQALARSIQASKMYLQELHFYRGSMDKASIVQLQSIYTPQRFMGTCTLWFQGSLLAPFTFADDVTPDTLEALVSVPSSLNDIGLPSFGYNKKGRELFRAILLGLKAASCGIRKLYFLHFLSDVNLSALLDAIPYFTSLTNIYFSNDFAEHKDKLLNAFCRNRKLVASNIKFCDQFDASEHARLEAYMERNRSLGPTIESTVKSMDVLEHDEKDDGVGSTGTDNGNGSLLPTLFGRPDCGLMTDPSHVFRAMVQLKEEVGPEETAGSKRRAVTESSTSWPSKRLKREASMEASGP